MSDRMKVRIAYTVEVNSFFRRAINYHYGKPGLASRKEVQRWFEQYGESESDNATHDLQQALERGEESVSPIPIPE